MKKEDLNYEPFYYVEPMRIIDDPVESIKFMFKYSDERNEISSFLKNCNTEDFLWVLIRVFKHEYGKASFFLSLVSRIIDKKM